MTSHHRAALIFAAVLILAAVACSLPGNLLRSAATRAIGSFEATLQSGGEVPGLPGLPEELFSGLTSSVPYDIYVGANVQGTCGPTTNSGGFSSLTFDSAIRGIRFSPPSETGLPGPAGGISQQGGVPIGVPGMGLLGEGGLGAFTFCPMYEGDEAHPCTVTQGPSPFEPSLSMAFGEGGIPVEPLVGTPGPSGGGEAVLMYSIGSTSDLSPIMVWDCEMGTGALGGALQPVQIVFSTSWDRLMLGEEFSLEARYEDEGERWHWTMRLVPSQ